MRPARARKGWAIEWWIAGLAAIGAALTAAVQISRQVEASTGLFVTLYFLTAVVAITAVLVGLLKKRTEEDRAWDQEVRSYLALGPGKPGRLPKVSEVSPYRLGVSRSAYAPDDDHRDDPYVQRQKTDERLRAAILGREPPFILVVGASKAGKSRTAYEAVLHTLPESPLIVPGSAEAIGKLFSLEPPLKLHPAPAVLWLDDLDEARLGALTPALLDRLGSDVVVVASMTSQRRDRIASNDSDIGRAARLALAQAKEIHLDFELNNEERRVAETLYPGERFAISIGESLVAADQLAARFNAGLTDNPAGRALVQASIDWRRAGLGRPIRDSELRELYPTYLPSLRMGLDPSDNLYEEGLAWACEPLVSHVALLEKVTVGAENEFIAFDYLVALMDGQNEEYPGRDVLPDIWHFIVDSLPEEEAMTAGLTAFLRNDLGGAERIWRTVAGRSSTYSTEAVFDLGILLEKRGDAEGAREAFQRAIDADHPDITPMAAGNLGNLLATRGDADGARAAFQRAIDSGQSEAAPMALFNLGVLLTEQGDTEGARRALQRAIDSNHPNAAPMAAINLGALLEGQGDIEGARTVLQQAIDSDHPHQAPKAAVNLGILLARQGDTEEARTVLQQVIDSNHPDFAPVASSNLGKLLVQEGDTQGARRALQRVIDSNHPGAAPLAAAYLGNLLEEQGDTKGAREAYQRAIDSEHPDAAPQATLSLGNLLGEQGDTEGARTVLQRAIDSNHPDFAPAALSLGSLLEEQGNIQGAGRALQRAIDSDHPDIAPMAAGYLGNLLEEQGDTEGAREAYQRAIDSNHPDTAPKAAVNLGNLLVRQRDIEGARRAYQRAIDSGHPRAAPAASRLLRSISR